MGVATIGRMAAWTVDATEQLALALGRGVIAAVDTPIAILRNPMAYIGGIINNGELLPLSGLFDSGAVLGMMRQAHRAGLEGLSIATFGQMPTMTTRFVQRVLKAAGFVGEDSWAYALHQHHIYPTWLGGLDDGPLLSLRGLEHVSDLEPQLFEYINSRIPEITSRSKGLVDRLIQQELLTQEKITKELFNFYKSRIPSLQDSHVMATLKAGLGG